MRQAMTHELATCGYFCGFLDCSDTETIYVVYQKLFVALAWMVLWLQDYFRGDILKAVSTSDKKEVKHERLEAQVLVFLILCHNRIKISCVVCTDDGWDLGNKRGTHWQTWGNVALMISNFQSRYTTWLLGRLYCICRKPSEFDTPLHNSVI